MSHHRLRDGHLREGLPIVDFEPDAYEIRQNGCAAGFGADGLGFAACFWAADREAVSSGVIRNIGVIKMEG